MPLSEHVYCVATAFKVTEWVEQGICVKFCIKLEHSSAETIWMNQKGHSYWQLMIGSFIMTMHPLTHHISCRDFWWNIKTPRWFSPTIAPFGTCNFWLFPKPKSPLKGKRFQTISETQENKTGQLMAIGRTVWGPKVPTLKGTEAALSCVQMFLVSSSIMSLFFIVHGWIPSGQTSYYPIFLTILWGRDDYSHFLVEETEASRS